MGAWTQQEFHQTLQNGSTSTTEPELNTRTSWVDAHIALSLVKQGTVTGNKCGLLLRDYAQQRLYKLGRFQQRHCGKVLIIGLLFLSLLGVGLKTATFETDLMELWVEDGGRLSKELEYTKSVLGENYGSSSQVIVQTPNDQKNNILTKTSLLRHLEAVMKATQVEVHLFDRIWTFDDICFKATLPSFEDVLAERMMEKMAPCVIVSPLDCFWEGSFPLGPKPPLELPYRFGFEPLSWKNMSPRLLVDILRETMPYSFDVIQDTLRRTGISDGYIKKPCLDPSNPECPPEAPNYQSEDGLELVAPLLTGGCSGISDLYTHWPEDMIMGGVIKNRSNTIVSAEALQTIIQLMGETELYNYYQGTYLVSSIEWTPDKARQIIEVFQKKFTEAVVTYNGMSNVTDSISCFTQASLDSLMQSFSEVSYLRLALGYGIMFVYCALSLMNFCDATNSHAGVGIVGVLLVSLSVVAGLGLCALLRLPFNATTTQVVPFISLGLGMDDVFLMVHSFAKNTAPPISDHKTEAGKLLKQTGPSILMSSLCNIGAFLLAAIIPIPAMRDFSLQVAIVLSVNMLSKLLILPAALNLDAWRKSAERIDVLCCVESADSTKVTAITMLPPPTPPESDKQETLAYTNPSGVNGVTTILAPFDYAECDGPSCAASSENLTDKARSTPFWNGSFNKCCNLSIESFVERFYLPFIDKTSFRVIICVTTVVTLCAAAYGISKVEVGMDLTDVVPRGSNEYVFLEAQNTYFGFYDIFLNTKGDFDYHTYENQLLLRQLYEDISSQDNMIQSDENSGGLWLDLLANWLNDLQESFDRDRSSFNGAISYGNASDDAMLAYKLLIQTGDVNRPLDESRIKDVRLVDSRRRIRSDGFYNYLTAWVYNDPFAFDISQATIRPLPNEWFYVPGDDEDLLIPRAPAITFARMSFYMHNLGDNEKILSSIKEIRDICDSYADRGLKSYPSGMLFTFWEQYLHIYKYLLIALFSTLFTIFVIISFALMSPLSAVLVIVTLSITVIQLFGLMGLIGVKLSAIPAVLLVISVGMGTEVVLHILSGFLTSIGNQSLRVKRSLSSMFTPVFHGAVSTLFGVIMLAVAEFDFIVRYFFLSFLSLVLLGAFNGLVLFPVILTMVGPAGDVQPGEKEATCIEIPKPNTPPVSTKSRLRKPKKHQHPDPDVLSTIAEEPSQYSSSSSCEDIAVVKPKVSVETMVEPSKRCSATSTTSKRHNVERTRPRAKVKATVTVEVHADFPGYTEKSTPECCRRAMTTDMADCTCTSETSV
ncbi:protein patched homolog 1-like [Watersipora subatra]|uniref:protein patched homolog 1-like n=1 Tax=Watersipora subatra TaxID=2589382 RepID=UPI00355C3715